MSFHSSANCILWNLPSGALKLSNTTGIKTALKMTPVSNPNKFPIGEPQGNDPNPNLAGVHQGDPRAGNPDAGNHDDGGIPVGPDGGIPAGPKEGIPVGSKEGNPAGSEEGIPVGSKEGIPVGPDEGIPQGLESSPNQTGGNGNNQDSSDAAKDNGNPAGVGNGTFAGAENGTPVGTGEETKDGETDGNGNPIVPGDKASNVTIAGKTVTVTHTNGSDEEEIVLVKETGDSNGGGSGDGSSSSSSSSESSGSTKSSKHGDDLTVTTHIKSVLLGKQFHQSSWASSRKDLVWAGSQRSSTNSASSSLTRIKLIPFLLVTPRSCTRTQPQNWFPVFTVTWLQSHWTRTPLLTFRN